MKDNQIPFKITIYMLKQDLKQAKYHKILKNWPNLTTFEKKKKKSHKTLLRSNHNQMTPD